MGNTACRLFGVICLVWLLDVFSPAVPVVSSADEKVRRAVWAGRFYPAERLELQELLNRLAQKARQTFSSPPNHQNLRALVLPHAGYIYSGWTAAHSAPLLAGHGFQKVLLIGPDHRIGFTGAAVSDATHWETPLGKTRLHADAGRLRQHALFRAIADADRVEHSLEVLLPYLQHYLPRPFDLVPVVVGQSNPANLLSPIESLIDARTLVVVSSDLSHFLSATAARKKDQRTLAAIMNLDAGALGAMDNAACGLRPLQLLIQLAHRFGWKPALLHYCTSADTAGEPGRVVGYAALAFFGDENMSRKASTGSVPSPEQGRQLVMLARQSIEKKLGIANNTEEHTADPGFQQEVFQKPGASFVTLKINHQLRGCIGSLQAVEALVENVRQNAINAAFHDPRFRSLSAKEARLMDVEVSVLSHPEPLAYKDSADLLTKLHPHKDGVVIRSGARSATFLPQVWEQLPRKEEFLSHLCRKAALPADAWQSGDLEVLTYQVTYFEEEK